MLIPLTFIVDSTINLMSGLYHKCEKIKHYSLCSKNYSFRNRDNMCMSHTPLALSCLPLLFFFFFFLFLVALLVTCYYLFILCLAWWCLFAQHHYCPYFSVSWHFPFNKFPELRKLPPQKVKRIFKRKSYPFTRICFYFFWIFGYSIKTQQH